MKNNIRPKSYKKTLLRADGKIDENLVLGAVPVASGLDDQFAITVENTTSVAKSVAILSGHYDTSAYVTTWVQDPTDKSITSITTVKTLSDPTELVQAGYSVDACADDGTYQGIVFGTTDASKTIRGFREYMHLNPRPLRGLQIVALNANAFNTTMRVTASSPFQRPAEKTINLVDFFSAYQYQNDRILIDFSENELEVSDITMLLVTIPAHTKMTFNLKF